MSLAKSNGSAESSVAVTLYLTGMSGLKVPEPVVSRLVEARIRTLERT